MKQDKDIIELLRSISPKCEFSPNHECWWYSIGLEPRVCQSCHDALQAFPSIAQALIIAVEALEHYTVPFIDPTNPSEAMEYAKEALSRIHSLHIE